ncbi:MAG TPA: dephospho-CoA kinase [bacterium]|nr:dephospho-CoA kinase [bacterium]
MLVLGVTGGVGSGKSTVAKSLGDRGARILDADAIVHELYRSGSLAQQIARTFGADVLDANGAVQRAKLAEIVFRDPERRRELEQLVHPAVRAYVLKEIETLRRQGFAGIVVIDAALLVESSHPYPLDALVVVAAPAELRLARLEARGMSRAEASRRMAAQATDEEKERRADFVVRNDGSPEDLEMRVDDMLHALGRDRRTLLG